MSEKELAARLTKLAKVIALNVRAARAAAQMTQKQLAEQMGCLVPAISRLESGRSVPSLTTVVKAAAVLRVTVCELVSEKK